jgi:cytochrome c oxidase assembly protein subunit 15
MRLRPWAWVALVLVCAQILLGGWTSTNYAAVACTEFPTCYGGLWWPPTNFGEAFTIWRGLGVNYEFGVLDSAARTAIHLTHRAAALAVFLYVGTLAVLVLRRARHLQHFRVGFVLAGTLLLQVGFGIANVLGHLPLPVAVAHSGGAALLLLAVVTLIHALSPPLGARSLAMEPAAASAVRYSS